MKRARLLNLREYNEQERKSAVALLIPLLQKQFTLPEGESYEEIAKDAVNEVKEKAIDVFDSKRMAESLCEKAFKIAQEWSGDEVEGESKQEPNEDADVERYEGILERLSDFHEASLKGTEKQINWAKKIRSEKIESIAAIIANREITLDTAIAFLSEKTQAHFWIENRNADVSAFF